MQISNYSSWLFKSYIDLGDVPKVAPFHAFSPIVEFLNLTTDARLPPIQAIISETFRRDLLANCGLQDFIVRDPREMPINLRSSNWALLCQYLDSYATLTRSQQLGVIELLNKLCFYNVSFDLFKKTKLENDIESFKIKFYGTLAQHALHLSSIEVGFSFDAFKKIFEEAPLNSLPAIHSSYQMIIANIKYDYNIKEANAWCEIHKKCLDASRDITEFDRYRFLSRYYRVYGFIPQAYGNYGEVANIMSEAERYARELVKLSEDGHFGSKHQNLIVIAAKEILFPVLESRSKEGKWSKDIDFALRYTRELIELSPNDSRPRLCLAELLIEMNFIKEAAAEYKKAFLIGPPGQAIAAYMYAQCMEVLGQKDEALLFYHLAHLKDPLGYSAFEGGRDLVSSYPKNFNHPLPSYPSFAFDVESQLRNFGDLSNPAKAVRAYQGSQFDESAI